MAKKKLPKKVAPTKRKGEEKTQWVKIFLGTFSKEEKAAIKRLAAADGVSMNTWFRNVGRKKAGMPSLY